MRRVPLASPELAWTPALPTQRQHGPSGSCADGDLPQSQFFSLVLELR